MVFDKKYKIKHFPDDDYWEIKYKGKKIKVEIKTKSLICNNREYFIENNEDFEEYFTSVNNIIEKVFLE